jgi:hypothetical protein
VEHCRVAVEGFDAAGAPPFLRFTARFALADAYLAVGDLAGAAGLGAALDDPADGDLSARALGALAAIALALQGRFDDGRALLSRAFADPVAWSSRQATASTSTTSSTRRRRRWPRPAPRAVRR